MKPKQHRWSSEEELVAAIDACHAESQRLLAASVELETEIELLVKELARFEALYDMQGGEAQEKTARKCNALRLEVKKKRDQVTKYCKRATRLVDMKAVKLGKALAAFRTVPMVPVCGNDLAVVSA